MTGRLRFNVVSPATEAKLGRDAYEQTLRECRGHLLPANHPYVRRVRRVLVRLLAPLREGGKNGINGGDGEEDLLKLGWEVHVVHSDSTNAFVLPG